MSAEAILGAIVASVSILVTVVLWSSDRHAKTLDKMDQRLTAHLAAETTRPSPQRESDMAAIGIALTDIRSDLAATRVDVAFVAGRQGIDLPPRS